MSYQWKYIPKNSCILYDLVSVEPLWLNSQYWGMQRFAAWLSTYSFTAHRIFLKINYFKWVKNNTSI